MTNPISWGADTPISMPETTTPESYASDLGGGHLFGLYGLTHKFTTTDAEIFYQPTYAPLPSAEGAG